MLIKIKPYFLLPDGRLYSPLPFYNFPIPANLCPVPSRKDLRITSRYGITNSTSTLIRLGSKNKQAREKLLFENFLFPCFILFFTTHTHLSLFTIQESIIHILAFFFFIHTVRNHLFPAYRIIKNFPTCYSPRYRLILFVADATASSSPTEPFR